MSKMHQNVVNVNSLGGWNKNNHASMEEWKYVSMQVFKYVSMEGWKYLSMQVFKYASVEGCKYASMQVCNHTSIK